MIEKSSPSGPLAGYRFPREVIAVAVRWYLRFGLSYRDVEELRAERVIIVDHVAVYRWVQTFDAAVRRRRPCEPTPGGRSGPSRKMPGRSGPRYRCEHRKSHRTRTPSRRSAQDLVQMHPRLSAPAEVAVQNRWAIASC